MTENISPFLYLALMGLKDLTIRLAISESGAIDHANAMLDKQPEWIRAKKALELAAQTGINPSEPK